MYVLFYTLLKKLFKKINNFKYLNMQLQILRSDWSRETMIGLDKSEILYLQNFKILPKKTNIMLHYIAV